MNHFNLLVDRNFRPEEIRALSNAIFNYMFQQEKKKIQYGYIEKSLYPETKIIQFTLCGMKKVNKNLALKIKSFVEGLSYFNSRIHSFTWENKIC